jgi:hypothetical protein
VARIRDAQYGGILSRSASVLVVVDTWREHSDGTVTAGGFTVDIRLVKAAPQWRVVDVFPAKPHTRATQLNAVARRILASDRIRLPASARADVAGGQIHDSVLHGLEALAASYMLDVSVLQSGHPQFVFGTTRLSDHPRGRAVDIWALNGRPLLLAGNHGIAKRAMRQAVTLGAYNVGGPIRLSGSPYFSDATHHDHIHLGFPI